MSTPESSAARAARIVHKTTCALNATGHRGPCTCGAESSAAQGRDGRKNHQRRTGNDPQGPTGRAGGTYTPSAATVHP